MLKTNNLPKRKSILREKAFILQLSFMFHHGSSKRAQWFVDTIAGLTIC